MSAELFPVELVAMDSPRLTWIKKHGVITLQFKRDGRTEPGVWYAGLPNPGDVVTPFDWFAEETGQWGDHRIGCGDTEDEAITDLARKNGLRLWNEEDAPAPLPQRVFADHLGGRNDEA